MRKKQHLAAETFTEFINQKHITNTTHAAKPLKIEKKGHKKAAISFTFIFAQRIWFFVKHQRNV